MTHLRQKMLDELQRRNYSQNTIYTYLRAVEDLLQAFSPFTARQTDWDQIISGRRSCAIKLPSDLVYGTRLHLPTLSFARLRGDPNSTGSIPCSQSPLSEGRRH